MRTNGGKCSPDPIILFFISNRCNNSKLLHWNKDGGGSITSDLIGKVADFL